MILYSKKPLILIYLISLLFISITCKPIKDNQYLESKNITDPTNLSNKLSDINLFFTKNQNDETYVLIWKINHREGKTIKLDNEGGGVSLSPDARYLAFEFGKKIDGQDRSGIWMKDLDDGQERKVILWEKDFSDVHLSSPSFSPDGNSLIFSVTWLDEEEIGVATVNLDGSDLQIISKVKNDLNDSPRYSPDGNKILVICAGKDKDTGQPGFMLCIMDSDGSNRKLLTEDGDVHGSYLFTPDSQKIVYSESEWGGIFDFRNRPYYRIKIMDTDGNNKSTILDWDRPINVMEISESGQEIIVLENDRDGMPTRLFVINRDGTNLRHLAYLDDFLANWFPEDN